MIFQESTIRKQKRKKKSFNLFIELKLGTHELLNSGRQMAGNDFYTFDEFVYNPINH